MALGRTHFLSAKGTQGKYKVGTRQLDDLFEFFT